MKSIPRVIAIFQIFSILASLALFSKNDAFAEDKKKAQTVLGTFSERNSNTTRLANLDEGFFEVGGSVALHNTFVAGDDYSHVVLAFASEYFVANRVSVGGQLYHYSTRGHNETGVGPSAKYYFFQQERFAPLLGLALLFNDSNDYDYFLSNKTTFGFKYFVTPAVAVSSGLSWYHRYGRYKRGSLGTLNRVSLELGLAVHL